MGINKLVFGALAAGCLTAAAGGAYLAVRHNAAEAGMAPEAVTAGLAPSPAVGGTDMEPVGASEGVIETPALEPAAEIEPVSRICSSSSALPGPSMASLPNTIRKRRWGVDGGMSQPSVFVPT